VLFLGRFDRQKGIDRLAEIVAELAGKAASSSRSSEKL
jgi:glycosyltransferase involved in cell wall biosynthesis